MDSSACVTGKSAACGEPVGLGLGDEVLRIWGDMGKTKMAYPPVARCSEFRQDGVQGLAV